MTKSKSLSFNEALDAFERYLSRLNPTLDSGEKLNGAQMLEFVRATKLTKAQKETLINFCARWLGIVTTREYLNEERMSEYHEIAKILSEIS